jgi:protease-4
MRPPNAVTLLLLSILPAAGLVGCGTPSFLITPVANTNRLEEIEVQPGRGWSQPKIAMIEVEGMLINARTGGFMQPTENALSLFTEQLERAENDSSVKAVVLRVNSPGGTVTTSDTMYQQVLGFKRRTKKPVVASCQEVAASGAYYVSCAADRIVAQPTTVVGSIGVIFNTFEFSGTMEKLGVTAEAIKSGRLKDMGSPFKALGADERAVMQSMVDEYYGRFVSIVTEHRPMGDDAERLKTATDGRVMSGQQALAMGLVDQAGMLEDAIDVARAMAGEPDAKVVMYKRPYGYRGSIYATGPHPQPDANVMRLELPGQGKFLPTGFYYLWQP